MMRRLALRRKKKETIKTSVVDKPISQENSLFLLPPELLIYILSYLTPQQLAIFSLVSREGRAFAGDDVLWRRFLEERQADSKINDCRSTWMQLFARTLPRVPAIPDEKNNKTDINVDSLFLPHNKIATDGQNAVITLLLERPQCINCIIEFYENNKPYILMLCFECQGEDISLSGKYVAETYIETRKLDFHLNWNGASMEISYPGSAFARHLDTVLYKHQTKPLTSKQDPLVWIERLLKEVLQENSRLYGMVILALIESFKGIYKDKLHAVSTPSLISKCLIS